MEITKAKKGSDDYLIDWCDYIIADLVKEKTDLVKAYNYFNGIRDHYQYENLEKNYGVGNPTSVGFTPLTKKHIDAIVGEYLTMAIKPKVACKDKKTLTNIFRERQLERDKLVKEFLSKYLNNEIYKSLMNQQDNKTEQLIDLEIKEEIDAIDQEINRNFISNYEISALNLIQHILTNRKMDFDNQKEQLVLDLLIGGQAYYKVKPTNNRKSFRIEVEDPLNTWIEKDPKSKYVKNAYKAVVRKWMSIEEIEIKYGDYLSKADLDTLRDWKNHFDDNENENFILVSGQMSRSGCEGLWNGVGVSPIDIDYRMNYNLVPVYEVEWIDSIKEDGKWIGKNYMATRIGADIYVLEDQYEMPKDEDTPNEPRLMLNGIWYTDGHGAPYSLMLATCKLQDNYDMVIYQRDNQVALSGTKGAIIDVATLPEFLGATPEERMMKSMAYRKIGSYIIDSAQEGVPVNLNTIFNGFDDTLNVNNMQAYQVVLQMIEETVSSITGVFRERLGGIEQRDAVANVEVGMQQSYIITKRYYKTMDLLVKEILLDCLDMAKDVYKDGFTGEITLGHQKRIVTMLPKYYTSTSYDIGLADSAEVIKEQEVIKQLGMQLASSNQMDPEILFIVMTSKSLTEMRELCMQSIRNKKLENNQVMQLQQQLEQAMQQQKEMQKQLEESTRKIAQLNEKKLNIEQQNNQMQQEIDYYKIETDKELKEKELELIKDRNKLEAVQIIADDGKGNDEVLNKKY